MDWELCGEKGAGGTDQVFLLGYSKCQCFEEFSLAPPILFSIKGFSNILSGGESGVGDGRSLGSSNGGAAGICLSLAAGFLRAARGHEGQGFHF